MTNKTYAVKATEDNIFVIVAFASEHQIPLDHLSDTMQINAQKGLETWVVLTRDQSHQVQKLAKINEMDFFGMYRQFSGSIVPMTSLDFFQEIRPV